MKYIIVPISPILQFGLNIACVFSDQHDIKSITAEAEAEY